MIEFWLPYHPAKGGSNLPERSILRSGLLLVGFDNAIGNVGATLCSHLVPKTLFQAGKVTRLPLGAF